MAETAFSYKAAVSPLASPASAWFPSEIYCWVSQTCMRTTSESFRIRTQTFLSLAAVRERGRRSHNLFSDASFYYRENLAKVWPRRRWMNIVTPFLPLFQFLHKK